MHNLNHFRAFFQRGSGFMNCETKGQIFFFLLNIENISQYGHDVTWGGKFFVLCIWLPCWYALAVTILMLMTFAANIHCTFTHCTR